MSTSVSNMCRRLEACTACSDEATSRLSVAADCTSCYTVHILSPVFQRSRATVFALSETNSTWLVNYICHILSFTGQSQAAWQCQSQAAWPVVNHRLHGQCQSQAAWPVATPTLY